jgi:hypothetical protein
MTIEKKPSTAATDTDPRGAELTARRRAHRKALAEISAPTLSAGAAAVAVRTYGRGRVVLALGGHFDPNALARLRTVLTDVHRNCSC